MPFSRMNGSTFAASSLLIARILSPFFSKLSRSSFRWGI